MATVRALKYNGGVSKEDAAKENTAALEKGICNLLGHIDNLRGVYGANVVVAINKFITDTDEEIAYIAKVCKQAGAECEICECWAKGGAGSVALAEKVLAAVEKGGKIRFSYSDDMDIIQKVQAVATRVYGAKEVEFSQKALASIAQIKKIGKENLPICIAKTQYSFSDDASKLGRPVGFTLHVQDVELRGGAGFLVVVCGNIMLMPGLSKTPNAINMTIDSATGEIKGLF